MTKIISRISLFFIPNASSNSPKRLKTKSIKKVKSTGDLSSHAMDAP